MTLPDTDSMVVTGVGSVSRAGVARGAPPADAEGLPAAPPPEPGLPQRRSPPLIERLGIRDPRLKISRYLDPVSKNAIVAMGEAMLDAGLEPQDIARDPFGYAVVAGTSRGPCVTRRALHDSLEARGGRMVSATLFSHCGYNIAAAMAAAAFGIRGPNLTLASAGDLGLLLLRTAALILSRGRAHTVFAGFTEPAGSGEPTGSSDEAACFFSLELPDRARDRGAGIRASVDRLSEALPSADPVRGAAGAERYRSLVSLAIRCASPGRRS